MRAASDSSVSPRWLPETRTEEEEEEIARGEREGGRDNPRLMQFLARGRKQEEEEFIGPFEI